MRIWWGNIVKELRLLLRDRVGLFLLIIMPVALVVLMTMLQDKTVKKLQMERINIVIVDEDHKLVGQKIRQGISESNLFNVLNEGEINRNEAFKLIKDSEADICIIVPDSSTRKIKRNIRNEIEMQMPANGSFTDTLQFNENIKIEIFFNPIMQYGQRMSMESIIREFVAKLETQFVFNSYANVLERFTQKKHEGEFPSQMITIHSQFIKSDKSKSIPGNSEHNIPAWTVFGIFFMVIPLSGQVVLERNALNFIRIKLAGVNSLIPILAKIGVYSLFAVVQSLIILFIGNLVFPFLNIESFQIQSFPNYIALSWIIGLAASSLAILIGTISKTANQAAGFGSVFVVILAAIGGILVPSYLMPQSLLNIAQFTPLYWSLTGYYHLILEKYSFFELYKEILPLLLFFIFNIILAATIENRKHN